MKFEIASAILLVQRTETRDPTPKAGYIQLTTHFTHWPHIEGRSREQIVELCFKSNSVMADSRITAIESLQGVLTLLESDWPDLLTDDCNPLDITLPWIENQGILTYDEFKKLKGQFVKSLQRAVNENYMTFNDSIGSYGISIETLNQSQNKLVNIRESLGSVDTILNSKSNILSELNQKRMEYSTTLDILEKINDVQKRLDTLQECIESQDFEKAVHIVNEVNEITESNSLFDIEALQGLQMRLDGLLSSLLDGLVGEIDAYLYAKNTSDFSSTLVTSKRVPINKGLIAFLKKIKNKAVDEDEQLEIQNGKYDDLYESFKKVQKISSESECLLRLVNSSEREIKQVIRRSITEIRGKYPSQIEINSSSDIENSKDPFASFNLLQGINGLIIKEVFTLVFSKIHFLLQRHIAIYEISKLSGYKYRLDKVWREVQKQLSLLMFNYIIDEKLLNDLEELDLKTKKKNSDSPFENVPKQFEYNDVGPIFQFSKLSISSLSQDLMNSMNKVFNEQGKGLISSQFSQQVKPGDSVFIGVDDVNESKNHVLVPPNIFNMAYITDEFIKFTDHVYEIYDVLENVSNGASSKNEITEFYNQFMELVFTSQLENTLMYQFDKLCDSQWQINGLLVASMSLMDFFSKVLILLDTTLYYRPAYVNIIFKLINKLSQKFGDVKQALSQTSNSQLLNKWITDTNLKNISNQIVRYLLDNNNENLVEKLNELQSKELTYSLSLGGEYIPKIDPKNFLSLEHMRSLVDLLAALSTILNWLPEMKRKVPEIFQDVDLIQRLTETWSLTIFSKSEFPLSSINLNNSAFGAGRGHHLKNVEGAVAGDIQAFLAVDAERDIIFDEYINNLRLLMNDVEILIRYEIRLECIWCMIQMMHNKQWEQDGDESVDLGVDNFCERINNISRIFNKVSKNIVSESKDEVKIRIFGGLAFWVDKLAIFESRRIQNMSKSGWMKMIVNLRVLQQMMRSIDNEIGIDINLISASNTNILNTSLRYFSIGNEGENFLTGIDKIKEEKLNLSEDDWKNLVRLVFSERMKRESVGNINKKYMAAQARLLKSLAVK